MEESVCALYKEGCYWVVWLKMNWKAKVMQRSFIPDINRICFAVLINTEMSVYDFLYCRLFHG